MSKICSHCEKPVWSNGLCRFHDTRQRTGTPLEAPFGGYKVPALQRFWSFVDIDPNGCWLWKGGKVPNGYGKFWYKNQTLIAHRWLYQILIGSVARELTLDHLCRNRACVNPAHLEIVTAKENVLRGTGHSANNARKTHCINGHAFTSANTRINNNGSRTCRACENARAVRDREKTKRMLQVSNCK